MLLRSTTSVPFPFTPLLPPFSPELPPPILTCLTILPCESVILILLSGANAGVLGTVCARGISIRFMGRAPEGVAVPPGVLHGTMGGVVGGVDSDEDGDE